MLLAAIATLGLHASPAFAVAAQERSTSELKVALEQKLEAFVAAGRAPGVSAGVVLADGTALALAAGLADKEKGVALAPTDRLCGGSTGKTFVTAVALQLAGEGALDLDAPVAKYLGHLEWFERVPNARDITVTHLLSHRSGVQRYEFDPEFVKAVLAAPDREWKPAELIAYVLDDPAPFAAGKGFTYSDTNFILLGLVIEKITGRTLYQEIRRRLLDPLTLYGIREQDRRELSGLVQGYPGADPFGAPERTLDANGRFFLNPQFEWAGGGFIGNGGDYARWAKALYEGPLLKSELRARMVAAEPAPELGPQARYGLGCEVWSDDETGESWGHRGFFPGYLIEIRYWPKERIAVAVQVNASDRSMLAKPLGALCRELRAVALGKD